MPIKKISQGVVWISFLFLNALPCAKAMDVEKEVQKLMDSQYGAYSSEARGRIYEGERGIYIIEDVSRTWISLPRGERLYVFVTGDIADERFRSHAAQGMAGAFILEERAGKTRLVAALKEMSFGTNGMGPGPADLVLIGPRQFYGWIVDHGWTGQGFINSWKTLLAPHGGKIVNAGHLLDYKSNSGFCDDEEARKGDASTKELKTCVCLEAAIQFDRLSSSEKAYPLQVRVTGKRAGKALKPKLFRINFDAKTGQYKIPKVLREPY